MSLPILYDRPRSSANVKSAFQLWPVTPLDEIELTMLIMNSYCFKQPHYLYKEGKSTAPHHHHQHTVNHRSVISGVSSNLRLMSYCVVDSCLMSINTCHSPLSLHTLYLRRLRVTLQKYTQAIASLITASALVARTTGRDEINQSFHIRSFTRGESPGMANETTYRTTSSR